MRPSKYRQPVAGPAQAAARKGGTWEKKSQRLIAPGPCAHWHRSALRMLGGTVRKMGRGHRRNRRLNPQAEGLRALPPPKNCARLLKRLGAIFLFTHAYLKDYTQIWAGEQISTENLSCSPHVFWGHVWVQFSRRGVDVSETPSELGLFVCKSGETCAALYKR
jgi:hypothetical protein